MKKQVMERYGLWATGTITILVIAILYVKVDFFPQSEEGGGAETLPVAAEEPERPAALVPLAIATNPVGASIFVDEEFVGISPLRGVAMPEGRRRFSVQKPDYVSLDTMILLTENVAELRIKLTKTGVSMLSIVTREPAPVIASEAAPRDDPPPPPVRDEVHPLASNHVKTPALSQTTPKPQPPPRPVEETPAKPVPSGKPQPPPAEAAPSPAATTEPVAEDIEEPRAPEGTLQISSEPSGASVTVGGQAVGVTPLVLSDIEAGPQQITLRLDGYEAFSTTAEVVAQQQTTVTGRLDPLTGTLKVLAKPWGTIYIDGELRKTETDVLYTTTLPPGNHRVRIEHPSLGRFEQFVEVSANQERFVTIDFNKTDSASQ